MKTNCNNTAAPAFHSGVSVRRGSSFVQVSSQKGVSVSCDLPLEVCSFTVDTWLHGRCMFVNTNFTHSIILFHIRVVSCAGTSTGLLGTNDNEAGNDFPLPDGSQAENMERFFQSWQVGPVCLQMSARSCLMDFVLTLVISVQFPSAICVCFQLKPECAGPPPTTQQLSKSSPPPLSCDYLFSSPDSPLSSCFRVVSARVHA